LETQGRSGYQRSIVRNDRRAVIFGFSRTAVGQPNLCLVAGPRLRWQWLHLRCATLGPIPVQNGRPGVVRDAVVSGTLSSGTRRTPGDRRLTSCCHGRKVRRWDWLWIMQSIRYDIVIGGRAGWVPFRHSCRCVGGFLLFSVGACLISFLSFCELVDPVQCGEVPGEGVQDA